MVILLCILAINLEKKLEKEQVTTFILIFIVPFFISTFLNDEIGRNSEFIGKATYTALMAIIVDVPFQLGLPHKSKEQIALPKVVSITLSGKKNEKIIKDENLFTILLSHFSPNCSVDAQNLIISDLYQLVSLDYPSFYEVKNSIILSKEIFKLSMYTKDSKLKELQIKLLSESSLNPLSVMCFQNKCSNNCLNILSDLIAYYIEKLPYTTAYITFYFRIAYAVEDLIFSSPTILDNPEFCTLLCRLLLLFHKAEIIYSSIPVYSQFDKRQMFGQNRVEALKNSDNFCNIFREGGAIRILLKLCFLFLHVDKNFGCLLLRFFIFKDAESKKLIKKYANVVCKKKEKKDLCKYNLLDLALKKKMDIIKRYSAINNEVITKVMGNEQSLLDSKSIQKNLGTCAKLKNLFDANDSILMLILCELFQASYFNLLNITNYAEFNPLEASKLLTEKKSKQKALPDKCSEIMKLILDIIKYDEKIILLLKIDAGKLIESMSANNAFAMFASTDIKLNNMYTMLSILNTENDFKLKLKKPQVGVKEETNEKIISNFVGIWNVFLECINNISKNIENPNIATVELMKLLINDQTINSIQPFLHFLTTHSLNIIDYILAMRMAYKISAQLPLTYEMNEYTKLSFEFQGLIRKYFCYTSIHREKMGKYSL